MMLHPFTYTLTLRDDAANARRPVSRFACIATIEPGDDLADCDWYVAKLTAFVLDIDGKPSAEEFEISGDDPLFDLILTDLLRADHQMITDAWEQHLAGGQGRAVAVECRAVH